MTGEEGLKTGNGWVLAMPWPLIVAGHIYLTLSNKGFSVMLTYRLKFVTFISYEPYLERLWPDQGTFIAQPLLETESAGLVKICLVF